MTMRAWWLLFVVGACGVAPSPASPNRTPSSQRSATPSTAGENSPSAPVTSSHALVTPSLATCVVPSDNNEVDRVAVSTDTVSFCITGSGVSRTCWRVDIATGAFTPQPVLAAPAESDPRAGFPDLGTPDDEVTDVDSSGTRALIRNTSRGTLELYDLGKKKRIASIAAWTKMGPFFHSAQFLGDLIVAHGVVSAVSSSPRIFNMRGEKVAEIGDKNFTTNDERPWHIAGDLYAFVAFESPVILLVDVRTGKLQRAFDLKPLAPDPDHMPDAGHHTLVHVAPSGSKIVTLGARPIPVVGVLDSKTGSVQPRTAPRCGTH